MRPLTSLLLLAAILPCQLLAQSGSTTDDVPVEALPYSQCLVELDSIVSLASNEIRRNLAAVTAAGSLAATIDRPAVDAGLAELEARCPSLPQLAHNRGVLAASVERWPEALAHLERSLLQDPRAADTYRLLQSIHEYQASLAYAKALDTPFNVRPPDLEWQDSTRLNADARARVEGRAHSHDDIEQSLRSVSTLEYELFAWWQALHTARGIEQFYVDDFPPESIRESKRRHANERWDDLQREISFTASDAVVVIETASRRQSLLLLRLVGTRWKIYQETRL
ncbi:hypothetical protein [Granulosicoccus sp. 3-233]|uniref:hypothetical protein n=1 Tax=Granulosicoccus sp. 3-233 TaxID=3417969 RepID=UPI003D358AC4